MKTHMHLHETKIPFRKYGIVMLRSDLNFDSLHLIHNEVLLQISVRDSFEKVKTELNRIIDKIEPALFNAPYHHWHGRKAMYITLEVPVKRKEQLLKFLDKNWKSFRRPSGALWRDHWGEHSLPHRIQFTFVAHSPGY